MVLVALAACDAKMPNKAEVTDLTKTIQKRLPNKFKEKSADYREMFSVDSDQIKRVLNDEQIKIFEKVKSCATWISCDGYVMPAAPPAQCDYGS
jgi:Glu-tRNA(Gln) amidotransferase subunit E-like FAD-binding protein